VVVITGSFNFTRAAEKKRRKPADHPIKRPGVIVSATAMLLAMHTIIATKTTAKDFS